jgi:A/G-specific adenine glycosylase
MPNFQGKESAIYTQGIMDLGATVCIRSQPRCSICPLNENCVAYQEGLTDSIPFKRNKVRVKEIDWIVLFLVRQSQEGKEILLEKRPTQGIWGGLWSPPCVEGGVSLQIRESLGEPLWLEKKTHMLTHRRLNLSPWLYDFSSNSGEEKLFDLSFFEEKKISKLSWFLIKTVSQLGMPKPMTDLMKDLGA